MAAVLQSAVQVLELSTANPLTAAVLKMVIGE
jgi:hypothetical protein